MEKIVTAAVSTRNVINRFDESIENLGKRVGMSIIKAAWTNGYYAVACNSAENRPPNDWEPEGKMFPGWAAIINPWGRVMAVADGEGNSETMVVSELCPEELEDRRKHPNFLAKELRPELYRFTDG